MSYVVTAPLVLAKVDGAVYYLYKDAPVPENIDPDQLADLLESKMVADTSAESDSAERKPSRARNKADWVAFAVAQGADDATAEALTKEELVQQYG